MQRNTNMLKKLRFADFVEFFAKMQSPVCPPNKLLSFRRILQHTDYQLVKFTILHFVWENKNSASESNSHIRSLMQHGLILQNISANR